MWIFVYIFEIFPDRCQFSFHILQQQLLTINTTDAGRCTAFPYPFALFFTDIERLVVFPYGAVLRISRVAPSHSCRVGHHSQYSLFQFFFRDFKVYYVPIAFAHLSAVRSWKLWNSRQNCFWFWKDFIVEIVKTPGDLPREFYVVNLIFTDWYSFSFVDQNIGCLKNGIDEKTSRGKIFVVQLTFYLFVSGNPLET